MLRGMTWKGMIYNWIQPDRNVQNEILNKAQTINRNNILNSNNDSDINDLFQLANVNDNEHDLLEISSQLKELHNINHTIGQTLDIQNQQLDRIYSKTNTIIDKTLITTLRISQILQQKNNLLYDFTTSFLGVYQFRDRLTNDFLSVSHDYNCYLSSSSKRNSFFNVFVKEKHIFILQNKKSLRFLGTTWYGTIRCVALTISPTEECYVDFTADDCYSGILCLANNWGHGGWLKRPKRLRQSTESTSDQNVQSKAQIDDNNCSTNEIQSNMLYEVTKNVSDKSDMIQFYVDLISQDINYDLQQFND
jgi:hypothetical protein